MGLRENIFRDTVADLSVRHAIVVPPTARVREVATVMRVRQLGCAFVVDDAGRTLGKFTQRQLMRLLVDDPGQLNAPVSRVMYTDADPIPLDRPIADLIRAMNSRQIRYLAVLDDQARVVGLTGQKGLMEYVADQFPRRVKVQRMKPLIGMMQREGA